MPDYFGTLCIKGLKTWGDAICLHRRDYFKCFKYCIPGLLFCPFLNILFLFLDLFCSVMNASNCWVMMAILFTFIWSLLGLKSCIYRLRALTVFACEFSARDFNFRLICFHFSSDTAYLYMCELRKRCRWQRFIWVL